MEGIILAGGFGTRLRSVVADVPKVMAPINGRPFLEIVLSNLARNGFTRITLSLGYRADQIVEHFGDRFGAMTLHYQIEQQPLGTGGAVRLALAHCAADCAFVFNGDTYIELETAEIVSLWNSWHIPIIVARHVDDTSRFGRLEVRNGKVCRFSEKGRSGPGVVNAGCYVLPPALLDAIPLGHAFSLEQDFLADAVQHAPFAVFETHGKFIDIGIPDDYARAQAELADRL